jgi:imidazolonepropionase-like amidohydrolase
VYSYSTSAMKRSLLLTLFTGLSLMARMAAGQPSPMKPDGTPPTRLLVIANVNVVDVVAGEILPNRMVMVEDGRITGIGTQGPGGRAVQRLDGRGKYLVPGLWDTHVQAPGAKARERELLSRLVARGVTSIGYFRSAAARPALLATQRAVEAGTQVGPRMVLAGSETGWNAPNQARSTDLLDMLTQMVAAGCTPAEALQAATVVPAAAAGCRYTLGQVASGFGADLVLLDANPLEDIRHLQQVRAVVLRGRLFEGAALQALRGERQATPLLSAKAAAVR